MPSTILLLYIWFNKGCIVIHKSRITNPFLWECNFPPVYGHTSVSYLKHCLGFEEAKHGDMQAALNVVNMCIKPNRTAELKKKYSGAVLLPIITNNRLPEAFARQIDMAIHKGACKIGAQSRKTLSAMERLLYIPCFSGEIKKGVNYIIVDDVVTQGGTVSALRKHIIFNGGNVVAVTALAFSADSRIIAPDVQDVYSLIDKFTFTLLNAALKKYNIADNVWELTRSQVRYLLNFEKIENIINSMSRISATLDISGDQRQAR